MVKKILVPLDGSEFSENVLPHVEPLWRRTKADVWFAHVCPRAVGTSLAAQLYLQQVREKLEGWPDEFRSMVLTGDAADQIVRQASQGKFDLIVLSSHGRSGLGRLFYGSTAEAILRRSDVPVMVVRPEAKPKTPGTILLPLDGSKRAEKAVAPALELASLFRARLLLLTVAPPRIPAETAIGNLLRVHGEALKRGLDTQVIVAYGDPVHGILDVAKREKADLIAIATHGRSGFERLKFGSVTESLLRRSPIPLLVQRATGRPRRHLLRRLGHRRLRRRLEELFSD